MNFKDAIRTLLFKKKLQTEYHQLFTVWGENLDKEHVLEEYPRPQLKRNYYMILNGYWDYCITSKEGWPEVFNGKILVPFSPESILSGVSRQLKPEEYLWYQRKIMIKSLVRGERCILHFGAVDQSCEVFINHVKVAEHSGGYLPFSIDITREIHTGENDLTVKVNDKTNTSYHSRGKQKLIRGGMYYTAQSGIWQTVWYEWVPDRYITSIKITPDLKTGSILLKINENVQDVGYSSRNNYMVKIYENGRVKKAITSDSPTMQIRIENCIYWTPENPFLYDMVITAGFDRVESYFAMRSFEIKKDLQGIDRIFLNGDPYFQNGLLDQGYWPDGLYTAPSDEAMIFDIKQAKKLGFNMLRKHIKIEPLRWYYHCDRLGMIVWQDMVNGGTEYNTLLVGYLPTLFPQIASHIKDHHYRWFGRKDKEGRREWTIECRETVELLYNCPSIAVWVPFNEGWGQFDAKKAYDLIRELDATRLIDHASGWYDQGIGDFESIHNYFHPLRAAYRNRAVIFSEIGGYACYIPEHSYSWQVYGYRIYLTKEALDQAFHELYREEIRSLREKGLSAVVYTQVSDVEDEVNGLFTYDRKICKVTLINDTFI